MLASLCQGRPNLSLFLFHPLPPVLNSYSLRLPLRLHFKLELSNYPSTLY